MGIGFFNAVTKRGYATVQNSTGEERLIETQPLSNYTILVLDQSLKNNSSASFVNTNVLRQGSAYDANVSAFLFNLNNKQNIYNVNGAAKLSHVDRRARVILPSTDIIMRLKQVRKVEILPGVIPMI